MSQYLVRWQTSAETSERRVEFPHYSQAEACLIGLVTQLDRGNGGWAEIWHEGGLVLRFGTEISPLDAEPATSPHAEASDMMRRGAE